MSLHTGVRFFRWGTSLRYLRRVDRFPPPLLTLRTRFIFAACRWPTLAPPPY